MTTSHKTCFKCQTTKPLEAFYRHAQMRDGHLNKCIECAKGDVRQHRATHDSVREYDRIRGPRQTVEYLQEARAKWPGKHAAHQAVGKAKRQGVLVTPCCCSVCGEDKKLHAHHDDYARPLDVRWLCARCHALWHAEHGESPNG